MHFGGRGIHDYKTKVTNGFKAIQICAENNIFVNDSHKHINNIEGTDGMALPCAWRKDCCSRRENRSLSSIQMNVAGINLFADSFNEGLGNDME